MKRTNLTQRQLKEILRYEPETGLFYWIVRRKAVQVGKVAGHVGRYIRIKINQKQYPAHCLAWLYMTGKWPRCGLDHRDANAHNNRWANLREATSLQNAANRRPSASNKYTRLKGVSFNKLGNRRKPWLAAIKVKGVTTFLGYFATPEEAHAAYVKAAKTAHGDFARAA